MIDFHDHAAFVEEERNGNRQIAAAVEQETVDNVVDARDFRSGKDGWKTEGLFGDESSGSLGVGWIVNADREDLQTRGGKGGAVLVEEAQLILVGRRDGGPES